MCSVRDNQPYECIFQKDFRIEMLVRGPNWKRTPELLEPFPHELQGNEKPWQVLKVYVCPILLVGTFLYSVGGWVFQNAK